MTRLRENWQGYLWEYRIFLALAVLASLADMASTVWLMHIHGPGAEGHPAVRTFSYMLGPIVGPMFDKAVQFFVLLGVTVFLRRWALYLFVTIIILYTWAAWYNVWGHDLYYPASSTSSPTWGCDAPAVVIPSPYWSDRGARRSLFAVMIQGLSTELTNIS